MGGGEEGEEHAAGGAPGELGVLDAGGAALRATHGLGKDAVFFPLLEEALRLLVFLLPHPDDHIGAGVPAHEEQSLRAGIVHKVGVQAGFDEAILQRLGGGFFVECGEGKGLLHIYFIVC